MSQDLANESDRDQRLSEVLLAYVEAAEAGRPPDRGQLLAAHPDLRAELEEFFASHDAVEQLAAPLREAASEAPGTPVRPRGQKASAGAPAELGQLGDYRLLREVGRGGMGVVYEAEQISLRRRVALKVLPFAAAIDPRQLQRFQNEALAAAHLRHENIVPVYAVGNERGVHYYAMQLIAGQSLAALISGLRRMASGPGAEQPAPPSRRGPAAETTGPYLYSGGEEETELGDAERLAAESISRERSSGGRRYFNWVAGLGRQAALALEHAHQLGIVHRDIKPANLLLDPRGQLWVTDFGLALVSNDAGLTVTGELLGTLRYASPEQALARRGLVDHRSDIYSLGATLYELLTLRPIFDGRDRHELLRQIADEEPVPPRTVDRTIPVELETIVLKALAKEPGDRYATAQELADDLQRFVEDQPIRARRPSLMERATKWARRHRSWVASAVAALLLSVAGLSAATAVTARAYERERVKSREAEEGFRQAGLKARESEESFRQAREAVDAFEKIAEEELAGQPHLQGVRRRLLEVALSYYQNFIDQRHDDPRIQAELEATRTRVGQIVAELTTLMGAGDYRLLREVDVRRDLGLSDGQKQELGRLDQRFEGRRHQVFHGYGKVSPEVGERRLLAVAQEQERAVANVLSRDQLRRFKQIVLWDRGAQAFSDPEVARALRLTAEQKKRIRDVQDQTNLALVRCGPYGGDRREPARNPEEVRKDAEQKILALLTPAQKTKWEELAGKPFHRKHQFNPRPWPGPGGPPGEPGRGPGRPGKGPRPPR